MVWLDCATCIQPTCLKQRIDCSIKSCIDIFDLSDITIQRSTPNRMRGLFSGPKAIDDTFGHFHLLTPIMLTQIGLAYRSELIWFFCKGGIERLCSVFISDQSCV
ncbi:hypothetical protein CHH27_01175 [Labrenzia sp. VG12]|nr:hypothetical protein CHH27_01175 [Labrenzia sp. VG12]